MVSLKFYRPNSSSPAMVCGWLSVWQKWVQGIYHGGKDGRFVGLTISHIYPPNFSKPRSPNPLEPPELFRIAWTFGYCCEMEQEVHKDGSCSNVLYCVMNAM